MYRYGVGEVLPIREHGEQVATARVVRLYEVSDGGRVVEAEVIGISPNYAGKLKIGISLSVPEEGVVGTFSSNSSNRSEARD